MSDELNRPATAPRLSDLTRRFLERGGTAAADDGLAEPYESAAPRVDARTAWDGAVAAVKHTPAGAPEMPPDWATLAAGANGPAVPFAAGHFPQMANDLHALLTAERLADLLPPRGVPHPAEAAVEWAVKRLAGGEPAVQLLALGVLRLARRFDLARGWLAGRAAPAGWEAAFANEAAALAWAAGEYGRAAELWRDAPESVPVLFNRGVAALFLGRPADAVGPLANAVARLDESDPWHHLGRLYLALADGK